MGIYRFVRWRAACAESLRLAGARYAPLAIVAAKAIVSLFFYRVFVYRQGFTGAPKYEYAKRGK